MSLGAIRTAISNAVNLAYPIDGWQVYDYEPIKPVPPCAIVGWPDTVDLHPTLDTSTVDYLFPVRVLFDYQTESVANDAMETIIDTFRDAIEDDTALNALCEVIVPRVRDIGFLITDGGMMRLTATFDVGVMA